MFRKMEMKKTIAIAAIGMILLSACSMNKGNFLKTYTSSYNITQTATRFAKALKDKGYSTISLVDRSNIAKKVDIYLKPTMTLTLDNPKVYSALLTCNQSMAIDLPIRVALYTELGGDVKLSYTDPEYWSLKHNIKDKNCINVVLKIAQDFDIATTSILKKK